MKSRTSAAAFLLAIFLLGGVSGAVSYYIYRNHVAESPSARSRVAARHNIVDEMAQSLKLDAQQKEKLDAIFSKSRGKYDALSQKFRPEYEKIRVETNSAIRDILNPDQRKHYDETVDKVDSRHREHIHDTPDGPNPEAPAK